MVEPGDFPILGSGDVTKVTGEIQILTEGDLAGLAAAFPDLETGDISKLISDVRAGNALTMVRMTSGSPTFRTDVTANLFPDLHTGDVVKISSGLLADAEVSRSVSIVSTESEAVAITPATGGPAPRLDDQISATVSLVGESVVYLSVPGEPGAGGVG
jgi:hypothetical protein